MHNSGQQLHHPHHPHPNPLPPAGEGISSVELPPGYPLRNRNWGQPVAEGDFQVIPRDQIRDRLVREKRGSHRECYDKSCQIDMGREMVAQKVLSARILKVAGRCHLAVTLGGRF